MPLGSQFEVILGIQANILDFSFKTPWTQEARTILCSKLLNLLRGSFSSKLIIKIYRHVDGAAKGEMCVVTSPS